MAALKIGIDFGKTIGVVESDRPVENSFGIIRQWVTRYGPDNVFVVSKARTKMRRKILNWLSRHSFVQETGIKAGNILFCDSYEDKRTIVEQHNIDVFIDDNVHVVRVLSACDQIKKIIWLNAEANLKDIGKPFRRKIVLASEWNRRDMQKTFMKINKKFF